MSIIFDPNCLKEGEERLFPVSRHRSRRIHKKLVRRHGGEFRKVPCIWKIGGVLMAHPSFRPELEAQIRQERDNQRQNPLFGGVA